ncbi:flippase [Vibrio alginolyticus]|uniref:flippase n=1 Tax=Vibrio alginolyticus TaxID=663 RepID=UPI0037553155|nr:flippase [Vibrio alginolyticus]
MQQGINSEVRIAKMKSSSPFYNTMILFLEKIVSMVLVLGTTIILARMLGPYEYGLINYLISVVTILIPFGALGLNSVITNEIIERSKMEEKILGTSLVLRFFGVCIISICTYLLSALMLTAYEQNLLTVLVFGNLFTCLYVFDFWIQAKMMNKYSSILRFGTILFGSLAKVICVFLGMNIEHLIYIYAIEVAIIGIGFYIVYSINSNKIKNLSFSLSEAKSLLTRSLWLMLSGVAAVIYLKIDQVMLGEMSGKYEVGIYSVATKLSEVWYFFPVAFVTSIFPKLISKKKSGEGYLNALQFSSNILFLSSVTLSIIITFLSDYIISILYGIEYLESSNILKIHIWASLFVFMQALLQKWLIMEKYYNISLLSQLSGAIVNIILNYIFIPKYGAIGSAWATLFSYMFCSFIVIGCFGRTRVIFKCFVKSFAFPFLLLIKKEKLQYHFLFEK